MIYSRVIKIDPTRTLTLRRAFIMALNKRFRWLKGIIKKSIVQNDCFGYKISKERDSEIENALTINEEISTEAFAYDRDPQKVAKFMDWLRTQTSNGLLEIMFGVQLGQATEDAWTNTYITSAYKKGILRGRQELRNKGYDVPSLDNNTLQTIFNSPIHADRVGLVYTRAFEGLNGITNEMSKQISETLAQGMADGRGPIQLARDVNDRVDKIGVTRAKILARTEII